MTKLRTKEEIDQEYSKCVARVGHIQETIIPDAYSQIDAQRDLIKKLKEELKELERNTEDKESA